MVGSLWLCEDSMYPPVLSERGRYGTVLHLEERRVTEKWHSAFNYQTVSPAHKLLRTVYMHSCSTMFIKR